MVRGDPLDQERTIARAIAAGVNYFDTAVQYGNRRIGKESWPHPTATEASQRSRRHESSVAERQFCPHCRGRGDIPRTQPDATAA